MTRRGRERAYRALKGYILGQMASQRRRGRKKRENKMEGSRDSRSGGNPDLEEGGGEGDVMLGSLVVFVLFGEGSSIGFL